MEQGTLAALSYVNHILGGPVAVYHPLPLLLISSPGFLGIKDYCRQKKGRRTGKINLITKKLAKRAGRFVFHKYNKSKDVLQLLQRLKFGH